MSIDRMGKLRHVTALLFYRRRYLGFTLGFLTLLLRFLGVFWGESMWRAYFPVFQGLRASQELLWGWVGFPLVYVWLPLLIFYLIWRLRKAWRSRVAVKGLPWYVRSANASRKLMNLLGFVLFLFHFVWGFNYLHNPLAEKLPKETPVLQAEELCFEAEWAIRNAELARAQIAGIGADSMTTDLLPADLQSKVGEAVTQLLDSLGLPQAKAGAAKWVRPQGALLRMGIAGIYNPFTGEGNVDAGLATVLIPEVMGHEITHGKGYTDEGTCNFVGMLACMTDHDPVLRYSGYFAYYLYVAGDLYKADPALQQTLRGTVDAGMAADLRAYRNTHRRYSGWMSRVGEQVNHAYLSTQGVQGGIVNYGKVVAYMTAFQASHHAGYQRRGH